MNTGLLWLIGGSLGLFLAGLAVTAIFILAMPVDYFLDDKPEDPASRSPLRLAVWILRNIAGFVLVMVGLVMSIPGVPGPGIVTILIGFMLLDFPGRKKLMRKIAGHAAVRQNLDRLRAKLGKPAFQFPPVSF